MLSVRPDLKYYVPSWSGNPVQNWTVGNTTLRFSYPTTASTSSNTILKFTSSVGGTAQVIVRLIQPSVHLNIAHEGYFLRVSITKDEIEPIYQVGSEVQDEGMEISELLIMDPADEVWTIEVTNASTGVRIGNATTASGECQFDTSRWQEGIYLVKASNGKDVITKKITVK